MRNFRVFSVKSCIKNKKKSKTLRLTWNFWITILWIIFFTCVFFRFFSTKASPRFIHLGELVLQKYIENVASDYKLFLLESNQSDSFMKITENRQGEITSIDYDMNQIYFLAEKLKNYLQEQVGNVDNQNISYVRSVIPKENGFVIFMPMGVASDSIFLANLGPKIPVMIRFVGSIFTNVQTKARDYGINNALLEVYLDVVISYEIVTPVTFEQKQYQYQLLLDSKVIQGIVPSLYGGYMNSKSSFLEVSFENNL